MGLAPDPSSAGKPFRPSNGTEGEIFASAFCYRCKRYAGDSLDMEDCEIEMNAIVYEIGESEYPKEWIYDESGQPCCTAFEPIGNEE